MQVYAPFWLAVKLEPLAIKGSRHVFKMIQWIRQLPIDVKSVVQKSIQINGYFCHPENILLSMITDADKTIRNDAFKKILRARSAGGDELRHFEKPSFDAINFECTRYQDMIDWKKVKITEPPVLQFYSNDYLKGFIDSQQIIDIPGDQKLKLHVLLLLQLCLFSHSFSLSIQNSYATHRTQSD